MNAKKTKPIIITPKMLDKAKKEHPHLFPGTKEHEEYLKQMKQIMEMFK